MEGEESCPRTAQVVKYEASHSLYLGLGKSEAYNSKSFIKLFSLRFAFVLYAVLNQREQFKVFYWVVIVFIYRQGYLT